MEFGGGDPFRVSLQDFDGLFITTSFIPSSMNKMSFLFSKIMLLLNVSIFVTRNDDIIMMGESSNNIIFTVEAHSFSHFDGIEEFYGMILRTSNDSFRSSPNQLGDFVKMNFTRALSFHTFQLLLNLLSSLSFILVED